MEGYSASPVEDCKAGMMHIGVRAHNSDMVDRSLYWFVVVVYMAVK